MLFNTLSFALAVFGAIASASPIRPRDFNCNVENVQCCKQVMSQHDAVRELGGLLVLPGDLVGNVGLSCSVGIASGDVEAKLSPSFAASRHQRPVAVQEHPCLLLASVKQRPR